MVNTVKPSGSFLSASGECMYSVPRVNALQEYPKQPVFVCSSRTNNFKLFRDSYSKVFACERSTPRFWICRWGDSQKRKRKRKRNETRSFKNVREASGDVAGELTRVRRRCRRDGEGRNNFNTFLRREVFIPGIMGYIMHR